MDMIDRAAGSKYGPLLAAASAAIIIFIFEPFSRGGAPGFDASVFAALGHMISEGYVLYRDMIDIKGPGIFLADAAFISLGGFRGIAIAEAAAFFAGTLSLIYAARRLSLSGAAAASALFLVLPFYLARYFYGNMTEDWAFSLAICSVYPAVRMLGNAQQAPAASGASAAVSRQGISGQRAPCACAALCAALMFAAASMRLNNGAFFGAEFLAVMLSLISSGRFRRAAALAAICGVTFLALAGCCAFYFYHEGVLNELLYYSFGIFFGGGYGSGGSGLSPSVGIVGFFRTGFWIPFLLTLTMVPAKIRKWRETDDAGRFCLLLVLFSLLPFAANSVSGHIYDHYDELYFPGTVFAMAYLLSYRHENSGGEAGSLPAAALASFSAFVLMALALPWNHHEWSMAQVFAWWALPAAAAVVAWRLCGRLGAGKKKTMAASLSAAIGAALYAGALLIPDLQTVHQRTMLTIGAALTGAGAGAFLLREHSSSGEQGGRARAVFTAVSLLSAIFLIGYFVMEGRFDYMPARFSARAAQHISVIGKEARPGDRLWAESVMPQYYVWTGLLPASKYLFFDNVSPGYDVKLAVLDELRKNPPKFIVVKKSFEKRLKEGTLPQSEKTLLSWIMQNYEKRMDGLYIRQ